MIASLRNLLTTFAACLFATGCATGSQAPNPLAAQLRQQLVLQDVVVTSASNASVGADSATLELVKPKIKSKLASSLAADLKGTRPARVEVEITRLLVNERLLSVTPISMATVHVVDVETGKTLASYTAAHEEPLGRATMIAVSTDDVIARGLAASITSHVLSDQAQTDRAVPNAVGGVLGDVL